jgi:hypothetical protein
MWLYDWLTTEESIENATIIHRSSREPMKDQYLWVEGGSFFLYDQMSRHHYYVTVELEGGKMESLEVGREVYERVSEGTVMKVRCAKGKILGKRIKGFA